MEPIYYVALAAVLSVVAQSWTHHRHFCRILAQAEESHKLSRKAIEKFANKVLAMKSPQEYAAYRSMSAEPESADSPVPDHTSGDVNNGRMKDRLAQNKLERLEKRIEEAEDYGDADAAPYEDSLR